MNQLGTAAVSAEVVVEEEEEDASGFVVAARMCGTRRWTVKVLTA